MSDRRLLFALCVALWLGLSPAVAPAATILVDNGLFNLFAVDGDRTADTLVVDNSPTDPTTVQVFSANPGFGDELGRAVVRGSSSLVVTGSQFSPVVEISAEDQSSLVYDAEGRFGDANWVVTLTGSASATVTPNGAFNELQAFGASTANFSGSAEAVLANDESHITFNGFAEQIGASGTASFSILDGFVDSTITALGDATLLIEGGEIRPTQILAAGSAEVEIKGGTVTLPFPFGVFISDASLVTVFGDDFEVDGAPVPFGAVSPTSGRLTGQLALGGLIDTNYSILDTARLVLAPIPEPNTAALVAVGLAGLGAAAGRRPSRRR